MSLFDYPRINFVGRLRLNPGTANNEDYAQPGSGQALMVPKDFPDNANEPMGLLQTSSVETRRFGMNDAEFVEWIQKPRTFDTPPDEDGKVATEQIFPAEWNYYGDMSSTAVHMRVVGVQREPLQVLTEPSDSEPLTRALGAKLSFYGNITDVNPEGSPPATQFFVDDLELRSRGGMSLISGGQVSKGTGLWINFFRNVNKVADDGSGTYVHHVIRGADLNLPGFEQADGVVMRYYLSLPLLDDPRVADPNIGNAVLEQYYMDKRQNPKTLDVVGTFAPYFEGEPIAMPPGRQLISRKQNIATPPGTINNGGGNIALAPAVAHQSGDLLSVDFSGSFPENYVNETGENPKFDFGPQWLCAVDGNTMAQIGPVDNLDVVAGDQKGWIFDFDLADSQARAMLDDPATRLMLLCEKHGSVLDEVDYYVVTDQLAVYGEQGGPDDRFVNQGENEPVTVSVYHRGVRLPPDRCPPISVWKYRSAPIQSPGNAELYATPFAPGDAIKISTDQAGAYLLTFWVEGETNPPLDGFPPEAYGDFAYPPTTFVVTWAPQIGVRVLPTADYRSYFVDPDAVELVGNASLTWEFVYEEVLRTYALLYPAMRNKFALDDPDAVARFAPYIIKYTSMDVWSSSRYMPPTRDLSESRRRLLHAWCRKAIAAR